MSDIKEDNLNEDTRNCIMCGAKLSQIETETLCHNCISNIASLAQRIPTVNKPKNPYLTINDNRWLLAGFMILLFGIFAGLNFLFVGIFTYIGIQSYIFSLVIIFLGAILMGIGYLKIYTDIKYERKYTNRLGKLSSEYYSRSTHIKDNTINKEPADLENVEEDDSI